MGGRQDGRSGRMGGGAEVEAEERMSGGVDGVRGKGVEWKGGVKGEEREQDGGLWRGGGMGDG